MFVGVFFADSSFAGVGCGWFQWVCLLLFEGVSNKERDFKCKKNTKQVFSRGNVSNKMWELCLRNWEIAKLHTNHQKRISVGNYCLLSFYFNDVSCRTHAIIFFVACINCLCIWDGVVKCKLIHCERLLRILQIQSLSKENKTHIFYFVALFGFNFLILCL